MRNLHSMVFAVTLLFGCGVEEPSEGEVADELEPTPGGPATSGYESCSSGEICFYTGPNGTGNKCTWRDFDEDWQSGGTICSWAALSNVCSVANKTGSRIEYFQDAYYQRRIGSTLNNGQGNLQCTYRLRSHRRM